jgi:hypothetical protein
LPGENVEVGDRRGALVDEVVFTQESDTAKIVELIEGGSHQVFAQGITNATVFRRIRDSVRADHEISYGSSAELTVNPAGPMFLDGRINPFLRAGDQGSLELADQPPLCGGGIVRRPCRSEVFAAQHGISGLCPPGRCGAGPRDSLPVRSGTGAPGYPRRNGEAGGRSWSKGVGCTRAEPRFGLRS